MFSKASLCVACFPLEVHVDMLRHHDQKQTGSWLQTFENRGLSKLLGVFDQSEMFSIVSPTINALLESTNPRAGRGKIMSPELNLDLHLQKHTELLQRFLVLGQVPAVQMQL